MRSPAALAGLALIVVSVADEAAAGDLAFNVGAANDYLFRGVSQTDGDPQVFAGADLTRGSGYAGVWASNVDYRDGTDAEVDFYGGFRPVLAGWTVDLGAIAYLYRGQPQGAGYDYLEAKLGASRAVGRAAVGLTAWWSPNFFGTERAATYAEATFSCRLNDRWNGSVAAGRQAVSSNADYAAWNLGATWAASESVSVDLRWSDTDAHDLGPAYDSRVVVAVKAVY